MKPDDLPVDHVDSHQSLNGLLGVNEGQWNLIASSDDAVAHALFLTELLQTESRGATRVHGPRLLVASRLSNHRQTLLVSSEVKPSPFEHVNMLDSTRCGFSDHVLVA